MYFVRNHVWSFLLPKVLRFFLTWNGSELASVLNLLKRGSMRKSSILLQRHNMVKFEIWISLCPFDSPCWETSVARFLAQTNSFSPRYEIFKKRATFNFLKNQVSRISLLSQSFCDRCFWAMSYLKERRKLNKIGNLSSLAHNLKRSKNLKNP